MSFIASITTSVDGYVTGPGDGPGCGLGIGGERLHYWVMGGPWTYTSEHDPTAMGPADKAFFDDIITGLGAGVCGRGMYEAAGAWGGTNPFGCPMFVLTHHTEDAPEASTGFVFVDDLASAMQRAAEAAAGGDVSIAGGADLIRQALAAGYVDELVVSTAQVILGAGKALFDGFEHDIELEIRRVYTSEYATHVRYAIKR